MENKTEPRPLHREQLRDDRRFIDYCQRDEHSSRKIEKNITIQFLEACEKDGLIVPLLTETQVMGDVQEGQPKERFIRYYSPFQIFLVSALIPNEAAEDGHLWDGGELWGPEAKERPRYIKWADWNSFSVDSYKNKYEPETMGVNYFRMSEDFHNLLRLIHSLDEERDYAKKTEDKMRHLVGLPVLQFDLNSVRNGEVDLASFQLDTAKLKTLLHNIGFYATKIDPLEYWYYYASRHPQWRRDNLKGQASIAQDLYGLCYVIYDLIEIYGGGKLPPLLEYIHPDHPPYLMDVAEYASGSDIKSALSAHKKLSEWLKNNEKLIEEITPFTQNKTYREHIQKYLDDAGKDLEEFERIYGSDRREVSSGHWVTVHPEKNFKLEDLDPHTKEMVESMLRQREKMSEEHRSRLESDISMAIYSRLRDVGMAVSGIAHDIHERIWPLINKTEHEKEMSVSDAWLEFDRKNDPKDPENQIKRAQFWRKDLVEFQKPLVEKIANLRQKQRELGGISSEPRLVFCAACREKPVKEHHGYHDKQISSEAVCDECFSKMTNTILNVSPEEGKKMKYAETKCDNCGEKVIFKFAVGNLISFKTQNDVAVQFTLEYGKLRVQAKCPECGEINEKVLEWGWHP